MKNKTVKFSEKQKQILNLLWVRKMLQNELAEVMSMKSSVLFYHLEKLIDEDLVHKRDSDSEIPNNLPRNLTSLVGRSTEIEGILDLIADYQARLISITGLGGSGKTRLALAVAEHYQLQTLSLEQADFPDGIYYVPLVGLSSYDQIPAAIGSALQINLESGIKGLLRFLSFQQTSC